MTENPFTKHPTEIGESYGQHLVHAAGAGFRLIGAGLACLVHAVLPFLFENTASDTVRGMYRGMTKRVDAPNWERHPII